MDLYTEAASFADRIEQELRNLQVWQATPPPPRAFQSRKAFFADTTSFYQWLQFVLLVRIREIVANRGAFPKASSVGAYAVRELDGNDDASELVGLLWEFDALIESPRGALKAR
jgi:uncharacterized protein YqcC (DUF446 family)